MAVVHKIAFILYFSEFSCITENIKKHILAPIPLTHNFKKKKKKKINRSKKKKKKPKNQKKSQHSPKTGGFFTIITSFSIYRGEGYDSIAPIFDEEDGNDSSPPSGP